MKQLQFSAMTEQAKPHRIIVRAACGHSVSRDLRADLSNEEIGLAVREIENLKCAICMVNVPKEAQ